jgi:hypothetical protein
MFFLTILVKDARRLGYLVAGNPLRDRGEQDEFVDIRLDDSSEETALVTATTLAEKYQLEYWELFRVVPVRGCHLVNGA